MAGLAVILALNAELAPTALTGTVIGDTLNADKLDGQEASASMHARTYRVYKPIAVDVAFSTAVACDPGDLAIGTAWANKDAGTEIVTAAPSIAPPPR